MFFICCHIIDYCTCQNLLYFCCFLKNTEIKAKQIKVNIDYDIQGGPKRMQLTINNFKKTRDRMKKLCALSRIQFFSQQGDTKNANFDEGVLILWPLF